MYYRKRPIEDLPHEETAIWTCMTEGCVGWIRDQFAFATLPTCHLCSNAMTAGVKLLPTLVNTNKDMKALKKGTPIS
ncbi:cold-shock protein [Paenibacillus xanthanilyticus]|uniref:Cold-shock protein n=1 Tax=Paenibacillus xanthanilyticus TaxID=1783531 RepID=A0ABV8KAR1_9BACL